MATVIEPVSIDQAEQLIRIARATFYDTWKPFNTHEDLMHYLDSTFNMETVSRELADSQLFTYLIISSDGRPAGYAKLRRDTSFPEMPGARLVEIEKFYFESAFHGTGLASLLMEDILRRIVQECSDWVCLGVDLRNHRAIRFYTRYGFEVFGKKSFRVGDKVDTDQLMRLRIS